MHLAVITPDDFITHLLPPPTRFQRDSRRQKPEVLTYLSKEPSSSACRFLPNLVSNNYRRRYNKAIGQDIEHEISRSGRSGIHIVSEVIEDLFPVESDNQQIG